MVLQGGKENGGISVPFSLLSVSWSWIFFVTYSEARHEREDIKHTDPFQTTNTEPLVLQLCTSLSPSALHVKGEVEFEIVHTGATSNKRRGPDLSFPGKAVPGFTSAGSPVPTCCAVHLSVLQLQHLSLPFCHQGRSLNTRATTYAIVSSPR